tara:strand:- start:813 stop:1193 length:381 start_codon:yes stop_codon:yes gene_type:complete
LISQYENASLDGVRLDRHDLMASAKLMLRFHEPAALAGIADGSRTETGGSMANRYGSNISAAVHWPRVAGCSPSITTVRCRGWSPASPKGDDAIEKHNALGCPYSSAPTARRVPGDESIGARAEQR